MSVYYISRTRHNFVSNRNGFYSPAACIACAYIPPTVPGRLQLYIHPRLEWSQVCGCGPCSRRLRLGGLARVVKLLLGLARKFAGPRILNSRQGECHVSRRVFVSGGRSIPGRVKRVSETMLDGWRCVSFPTRATHVRVERQCYLQHRRHCRDPQRPEHEHTHICLPGRITAESLRNWRLYNMELCSPCLV